MAPKRVLFHVIPDSIRDPPSYLRRCKAAGPRINSGVTERGRIGRARLRHREAAGNPDLPRNSGKCRTASEKARLKVSAVPAVSGEPAHSS